MNIASITDHVFLQPTATLTDIEKLCEEAKQYGFRSVCIPPLFIKKAKEYLKGSNVKLIAAIGFPFGYSAIEAKLAETVLAIVDGADGLDMVINIAALKNGDWQFLAKEINTILPIVRNKNKTMSVILETGVLTDKEIITCCDIYGAAAVNEIKTSTGFAATGATADAVRLLRKHLADAIGINASGLINNYSFAKQLLDAGASFISTADAVQIVKEASVLN